MIFVLALILVAAIGLTSLSFVTDRGCKQIDDSRNMLNTNAIVKKTTRQQNGVTAVTLIGMTLILALAVVFE